MLTYFMTISGLFIETSARQIDRGKWGIIKKIDSFMVILFFSIFLFVSACGAQNLISNPGFESPMERNEITDWNLVDGWNSTGGSSGTERNEFYAPFEGAWYAFQKENGQDIYQETEETVSKGKSYKLVLWARSINRPGVAAKTTIEAKLLYDTTTVACSIKKLNAPQLKGVAAIQPNDDGANVWIDGKYRHQFSDVHMYQPLRYDPVQDPWLLVEDSNYEKLDGLGWAVGTIIVNGHKFIYGTIYRDIPGSFYSSINMTKVLSTNGYRYVWSEPVTVLSHDGSEFPWVEDAHCYYDEATGKLWMAWGGGTCYVSELDPHDGMLLGHPDNAEIDTHPVGMHVPVATWPETREGWCGDRYSACWMEGAALYKHNGYWYYFGSYGNLGKDYTIRYGRGDNPTGPFYDKNGVSLMEFDKKRNRYGNSMLLGAEGEQLVPGHPHIWQEDGQYYMGYDYRKIPSEEMDYMGIRKLFWVNDWPTIWQPATVEFNADEHPGAIGKKIKVAFKNVGEPQSVMAVDAISLTATNNEQW